MLNFFKSKIFQRLFLYFTLIIIFTLILVSAVLYTTTKNSMESQQFTVAEDCKDQVIKSINLWLDDKVNFVKTQAYYLGNMDEKKLSSSEVFEIINTQLKLNKNYLDILILNKDGDIINSVVGPTSQVNLSNRDYFINGMNGKSTITGIYRGAKTGIPVIAIAEPIYVDGNPQYVVAAIIGLERIKEILEAQNFGDWGHVYMVDDKGSFITDSKFIKEFVKGIQVPSEYKLNSLAVTDLLNKKKGTNLYVDFKGEKVLGSYEWLDILNVGLIVELRDKMIMKPINEFMKVFVQLSIFIVVLGIFLSFTFSKKFIYPIEALISTIEDIIKMNYSQPLDIKTDTELDKLTVHFNTMQAVIKLREEQLRKTNEELKIQTAEAIEANKLKSQFLANMSHELRTPLNSIIGFTSRVLKKSGDLLPHTQKENLVIVKQEANNLLELINNLLDYSKVEAGKMEVYNEKFNLVMLIDQVCKILIPLFQEKGLRLKLALYDSESIEMFSDKLKIKQILMNLLSNAIKYSEKGTINLSVDRDNDVLCIKIMDEGIGIEEKNLDNIFDEFRQIDGSYTRKVGGTGLGLSITKKFIEMLGGQIKVSSNIGTGSCFTVWIPEMIPDLINIKRGISNANTGDKKIVCIDDDPNIHKLYKQYLDESDYKLFSLDGYGEVIDKVIEIMPEVIILDIILPEKDGWDILDALKKNSITQNIPVVIISILSEKKIAFSMGADEYLIKPVNQKELIEKISTVIDKKNELDIIVS